MRSIDADELLSLYENTGTLNIDAYKVTVPVVRQNIMDAPTLDYAPKQQWISVKDRFPEKQGKYIVCVRRQYYDFYSLYITVIHFRGKTKWATENEFITHWMPLPEPPKEG